MFISKLLAALAVSLVLLVTPAAVDAPRYGLGTPVRESDLSAWNIDVSPDGEGLPNGRGGVIEGERLFSVKCAACHGAQTSVPLWGRGPLTQGETIGNFWPYATTIFDFIRRAMPKSEPQSLTPRETYALTAYILWENGIVQRNAVMDKYALPTIRMPNRNGFILKDPRPDVP